MISQLRLTLEGDRSDAQLAELARRLSRDLSRQPDVSAEIASRPGEAGEKALDVPLLGEILIGLAGSRAVEGLLAVLKARFGQDAKLTIEYEGDGVRAKISGPITPDEASAIFGRLVSEARKEG